MHIQIKVGVHDHQNLILLQNYFLTMLFAGQKMQAILMVTLYNYDTKQEGGVGYLHMSSASLP